MPIPQPHTNRFFYHFTHIDNLSGLLKTGLLAKGHADFPGAFQSIAEEGIQERRSQMGVTCGPGGVVHDYVPFYFGAKSPMLLGVINKKNIDQQDILYFEFPIALLDQTEAVFTDASANTAVAPNFYSDPQDLAKLNWAEIDSNKWTSDSDELRHQRMAEALIHNRFPLSAASACIVWNAQAKKNVEEITEKTDGFPKIGYEDHPRWHYFTNLSEADKKGLSLVTGPKGIADFYQCVCEHFETHIGDNAETAPYNNYRELLKALRINFGSIQETADLVGLETINKVHNETVDVHTKQVVETLLGLQGFQDLESRQKELIELAAYLHDIGKGPRERWLDSKTGRCFQKLDPDHPVGAMPMVARIFTEEIGLIDINDAKLVAKLVCYHDLIGDVLGRDRDKAQIIQAANNEEELKLLFLLGKADATTLGFYWDQKKADDMFVNALAAIGIK